MAQERVKAKFVATGKSNTYILILFNWICNMVLSIVFITQVQIIVTDN